MVEATTFKHGYLGSDNLNYYHLLEPVEKDQDRSIFSKVEETPVEDENLEALMTELKTVEDRQGAIQKGFNDVKEFIGVGTSAKKCDETIEKYKKGEVTFEEAMAEIDKYEEKQDSGLNLTANIFVSVLAIAAAAVVSVATAGTGAPAAAIIAGKIVAGATVGAVAKAGIKTLDRATNNVEGDDFDGKQIAKDALPGAVTGGMAAATMGNGRAAGTVKEAVKINAVKCAKTGAITGGISGSANYAIDCALDEDKDFTAAGLADATLTNAAVGATVGGIMGTTNGALKTVGVIKHGGANATAFRDVAADAACSANYKLLNKTIKDIPDIAA